MTNTNERKTYKTKFVFQDGVVTTFIHDAETGNVNHTTSTDGTEEFFNYADDGHLISAQISNSEGSELYEYDENSNCIHYKIPNLGDVKCGLNETSVEEGYRRKYP